MSTKKSILELLEENRGKSISGESIATLLKVSRNTVWKAVKDLEKEGYKIQAAPNKGYCLSDENDILSVPGMLRYLNVREQSSRIHVYETLESTNKTAKEMAIAGAEHGTVVIADRQTNGRGRYGRKFYSPAGHGIYMSFILHPCELHLEETTMVTIFAAVAVCEAIETVTGKPARIKWVNDIFSGRKKICGILTEAVSDFESGTIQWIVVGIGINFRAPATGFGEELQEIAGAVYSEEPSTVRNQLAAEIINKILETGRSYDTQSHEIRSGNREGSDRGELCLCYKQRLMMLGERVWVSGVRESFEGVALDVDERGRLLVEKSEGTTCYLDAGEVSILFTP